MISSVSLSWTRLSQTVRSTINAGRKSFPGCSVQYQYNRLHSTIASENFDSGINIRNIGIIAHIDAGKTTTTERMLYYSGLTRQLGNVDEGSTVTDFLPAERARGITIQSAAVTFQWPPAVSRSQEAEQSSQNPVNSCIINLIDTPGHADFTFEVSRSLRVLDGVVCILDGVAGVEAQTEEVWSQAQQYHLPKLVYVNKLDRHGAAFGLTVKSIASRLGIWPAICQIPWYSEDNHLCGLVDVVNLRAMRWPRDGDGRLFDEIGLEQLRASEPELAEETFKARSALIELLSEHDEIIVDKFLSFGEDFLAVPPEHILESLRSCVLQETPGIVPVFAGASFRNVGVQPLLNAIAQLLPSPLQKPRGTLSSMMQNESVASPNNSGDVSVTPAFFTPAPQSTAKTDTGLFNIGQLESCALAFKIVHDAKRGVLIYVRVYYGILNRNAMVWNASLGTTERVPRLLRMYASESVEIPNIRMGEIGVIVGLKNARTGDTLITAKGRVLKNKPPTYFAGLQLQTIDVPPPVFIASVESRSLGDETSVTDALALILREDPSLRLSVDEDSGQKLLGGMGELHLEIARDRLSHELGAKARIGQVEIGYRECPSTSSALETANIDRQVAGVASKARCSVLVGMLSDSLMREDAQDDENVMYRDGNRISVQFTYLGMKRQTETAFPYPHIPLKDIRSALQQGASAALARGPQYSYPMYSTNAEVYFDLSEDIQGSDPTPAAVSMAARLATLNALRDCNRRQSTTLMEPVMKVVISVGEDDLGSVLHDLSSSRGGRILVLDDADGVFKSRDRSVAAATSRIDLSKIYAPPDPFSGHHSPLAESGSNLLQLNTRRRYVTALVPLKEMTGYARHLRSRTSGRGTFSMHLEAFQRMSKKRENEAIKILKGLT